MNIDEANKKIETIREKLLELQKITHISYDAFDEDPLTGAPNMEGSLHMPSEYPEEDKKVSACWEEIQRSVPAGFSIDGNLVRHLSFGQAHDWADISNKDVPRELIKVAEYKHQLELVGYLDTLHPEVKRVEDIVLRGDYDAALKVVYSSLESKIRDILKLPASESCVPAIGKAFRERTLIPPNDENMEAVRNFLQGVIGYYRQIIIHKTLPANRNRLEASLSLFALAHEAFILIDDCTHQIDF